MSPSPSLPAQQFASAAGGSVDLTTWFLNAKRSLSSVNLCARANGLVDSARHSLQEAAVTSAKCSFLRDGMQDQLEIAKLLNRKMHAIQNSSRAEFEKILTELDNADIRLNQMLEVLRNSIVDPAFSVSTPGNDEANVKARTLHDFIDDAGIENLKAKLRHSIDQVQESYNVLLVSLSTFDADLTALSTSVSNLPDLSSSSRASQNSSSLSESIKPYIHTLEEHAEAMAQLLESLTRHFDQCSDALKASEATHTHSQEAGMSESLSPHEKAQVYAVLERDAGEVDDVVAELQDRLVEMEQISSHVGKYMYDLQTASRNTMATFGLFEEFQGNLGGYLESVREFEMQQEGYAKAMEERLEELWLLGEYYEGFIGAYDALVVEVGRRKGMAVRMESIVKETTKKLQGLYEDDAQHRESFRAEQGRFLPVDIWPGLMDPPVRYLAERDLGGGRELPALSKEVIDRALRRQQEQGKGL